MEVDPSLKTCLVVCSVNILTVIQNKVYIMREEFQRLLFEMFEEFLFMAVYHV